MVKQLVKLSLRDECKRYLAVSRLAATTKQLYDIYLVRWADTMEAKDIQWEEVEAIDLANWLDDHPDWSDSTKHSAVCAVRGLYAWRFGNHHPILDFHIRREEAGPQRTPNMAKLETLLDLFHTGTPRDLCYRAIITLCLDTGLRASEVCRLTLGNLDMSKGLLYVCRKGGHWKPARFFNYTRECLNAWLAVRSSIAKGSVKTVFVVMFGETKGEPMNRNGLRIAFNRFGEEAGIGKFSPHDLRRAFATMAIDNGASSRLVAAAGGWKDLAMLDRYTQAIALERMVEFSPVDIMMGTRRQPAVIAQGQV